MKLKTIDVELALANHFNYLRNLIVPNVMWGLNFRHELDLLVITQSNYCYEVEIKVSKHDLIRDKQKRWGHKDYWNRIRALYFAMPCYLEPHIWHAPDRAGIILVYPKAKAASQICQVVRTPKIETSARKLTDEERYKAARLGALRIWGLKKKIKAAQF